MKTHIRFKIGQPIRHKQNHYRGVIIDLDEKFAQSENWYKTITTDFPPKNKPWYYLLVNDSTCVAYVPESHLEPDLSGQPIKHTLMKEYFTEFCSGLYQKNITSFAPEILLDHKGYDSPNLKN